MRSLLLLMMLLSMLCAAAAQGQAQDNANTLRLCGRAFLRAVVYTCGGSRWRRLLGEEETLQDGEYTATLIHIFCFAVNFPNVNQITALTSGKQRLISWQVVKSQN